MPSWWVEKSEDGVCRNRGNGRKENVNRLVLFGFRLHISNLARDVLEVGFIV